MKIEKIRLRRLHGSINVENNFWEERLVQPLDVYRNFSEKGTRGVIPDITGIDISGKPNSSMSHDAVFIQIETDEGIHGIGGPITDSIAYIVATQLTKFLIGANPLSIEYLWDIMHRSQVHGRQGETMMAISAVDCALWDLKGKYFGVPVYVLLGGPTRQKVPAYASMLGFNVTDMGMVKERALEYKKRGYTAQKWFFRYGPMSGYEGLKKNVEMVKTVRETVGDDYDIMLDCWQSMDVGYVLKLIKNIEDYNPAWLEECVMPDRVSSYKKIREKTSIPLSGAEHEYTRWGFKRFIDQEALDILQPDIYWAGGLSETLKIATLGTAADLITIPHGHSTQAGAHFSVTQSPIHTPYQEYLIKWNVIHQHFLKDPIVPKHGNIKIPTIPGMAMDLDPEKIQKEEEFLPKLK